MGLVKTVLMGLLLACISGPAMAASGPALALTGHWVGITSVLIFAGAYVLVIVEEHTDFRKSIPVLVGAGLIWALVAYKYSAQGMPDVTKIQLEHFLIEFGELFLFLLVAMTYVNTMSERNLFEALRAWLVRQGLGFRSLFWVTGGITFFLSPIIDNLTAALVMSAVVMAVGKGNPRFISLSCINIVIAANAGGAFSPFGDITTLMVWQHGTVDFLTFFALFLPAAVNYLVPAGIMFFAVPAEHPHVSADAVVMKRGALTVVALFALTIVTAISFHNFLHLPPFFGMMLGLGFLKIYGYYLSRTHVPTPEDRADYGQAGDVTPFDSFRELARAEWDTLLFFFGVIMCVGGLGFIGYLEMISQYFYGELGATTANVLLGGVSAVLDNIPVMVAVLQMNPEMDLQQWLLITLTTGAGGSMLSIGSAAGVALMGQARGAYTFMSHLKWTPAIVLGYGLSIWVHLLISGRYVGIMP